MSLSKLVLKTPDYVILGLTLAVSTAIGLYFQCVTKKKTNDEYLLAGKNMPLLPVIFSLMASFMSAVTIMGIPAEMYVFGTSMAFINIGYAIGNILSIYVFLPLYFTNDVSSVYEYLEKRFGKVIRRLVSAAFTVQTCLFTSITLYAPALALSAVTDLSVWSSIITIGVVCTFYCTLGGMKAVLWADVFQAILMFICVFVIIIKGSIELGGVGNVFHIAKEGGRLIIPRISMNFSTQYTLFNVLLQGIITAFSAFAGTQIQVQRLRSLRNQTRSKVAALCSIPLIIGFHLLCCLCGLILYAHFRNCDPLSGPNKHIHSPDQLLPYYITNSMKDYPGLPGLCIAGVFSASLSTLSSTINCLSAVTVEDFIKPVSPSCSQNVLTTKIISLIYGVLCIGISFTLSAMGNLIRMTFIITGLSVGPSLGVFILAACTKTASHQGSILGFALSFVVATFLSFAVNQSSPPMLPLTNNCTISSLNSFQHGTLLAEETIDFSKIVSIQEGFSIPISHMWISSITLLVSLVIGYFGSVILNFYRGGPVEVPDIYLSPVRLKFSKPKSNISEKLLEKETSSSNSRKSQSIYLHYVSSV